MKKEYLEQLKNAPVEVKLIKMADAYDNFIDSATAKGDGLVGRMKGKALKYIENFKGDSDIVLLDAMEKVRKLIGGQNG